MAQSTSTCRARHLFTWCPQRPPYASLLGLPQGQPLLAPDARVAPHFRELERTKLGAVRSGSAEARGSARVKVWDSVPEATLLDAAGERTR